MSNSNLHVRRHPISGTFVFLLLAVFAVFSTVIMLLGAQMYQNVREQTEFHSDKRVLAQYIINAVHANDTADTVLVRQEKGVDVLVFQWDPEGMSYETRIFCQDGVLYEQFGEAEDELNEKYAETICEAQEFVPQLEDGGLEICFTDANGKTETLYIALHCS